MSAARATGAPPASRTTRFTHSLLVSLISSRRWAGLAMPRGPYVLRPCCKGFLYYFQIVRCVIFKISNCPVLFSHPPSNVGPAPAQTRQQLPRLSQMSSRAPARTRQPWPGASGGGAGGARDGVGDGGVTFRLRVESSIYRWCYLN